MKYRIATLTISQEQRLLNSGGFLNALESRPNDQNLSNKNLFHRMGYEPGARCMDAYFLNSRENDMVRRIELAAADSRRDGETGIDAEADGTEPAAFSPPISYTVREAPPLFTPLLFAGADAVQALPAAQSLPLYHDTNLLVILDLSVLRAVGSSGREDLLRTRLGPVQTVLSNLLHAYGMIGDMRVAIAGFANGGCLHTSWRPLAAAIGSLDSLTSASLFNDSDPVEVAQSAWQRGGSFTDKARNIMYFLSESDPETGNEIGVYLSDAERQAWSDFVAGGAGASDRVISVGLHHRHPVH